MDDTFPLKYLKRHESGYRGEFKGRPLLCYSVGNGRFRLEFVRSGRGADAPVAHVEGPKYGELLLDWLDTLDYSAPAKMRRKDGWWWFKGYPMVPQSGDGRTGASDWLMKGSPVPVTFYRLSNARAFLTAVKETP
ncbi:hypothetical protein [Candidatus Solirubrobacter pratensis]|uniref:hypothetical protein n=1 Tax=Candidatus Solirubrobacter pratensis TaxID=1298857 RepID=UPI00041C1B3C|nr:hypothetical protein [Candidatus Solirubrobacter pratensis]